MGYQATQNPLKSDLFNKANAVSKSMALTTLGRASIIYFKPFPELINPSFRSL